MKILHISMIPIWVMGKKSGMPTIQKMLDYYKRKGIKQIFLYFSPDLFSDPIKIKVN